MMFDRELDARIAVVTAEAPGSERLERIARSLPPTRAVRPLPSDSTLALLACAGFLVLACLGAASAGFQGFHSLRIEQRMILYGTIAASALLLALASAGQMIPGARRRVGPALAVLFPVLALAVTVPVLFPDFAMDRFVKLGFPCLRFGTLCAIPAAALMWLLMRRGFLTSPVAAATVGGAFAGFAGFGVLALHCPVQNAPHILVWHLGVLALPTAAGAVIGWLWAKF